MMLRNPEEGQISECLRAATLRENSSRKLQYSQLSTTRRLELQYLLLQSLCILHSFVLSCHQPCRLRSPEIFLWFRELFDINRWSCFDSLHPTDVSRFYFFFHCLTPIHVELVVALIFCQLPIFDCNNCRCDLRNEVTIMRNDHDRPHEMLQSLLEHFFRGNIWKRTGSVRVSPELMAP